MDRQEMEGTFTVAANAKLRYDGNLEIGVGSFWIEEYIDDQGEAHRGITAGLWLLTLDGTQENQYRRIGRGQALVYGQYLIRAIEVDSSDQVPSVRLEISVIE